MESTIQEREEKFKHFENKFDEVNTLETKLKDVENPVQIKAKENKTLSEKVSKLKVIVKNNEKKSFKCDQCDFSSISEQVLKTHSKRKHTKTTIDKVTESFNKKVSLL